MLRLRTRSKSRASRRGAHPPAPGAGAPPAGATGAAAALTAGRAMTGREVGSPDFVRAQRRVREAGGPQDHAVYGCSCGQIFEAHVTAAVACPRCGDSQPW
jgi:hypothetical protein